MELRSNGWRRTRALALVAVVALLAGACGSGGNGNKKSGSNGPVELTLEDHQKPRVELVKKLLPQFEQQMKAQGKQITVKLIEGPAEDEAFKSKLTLDYNSGHAPDVTSIGAADASAFAASGYLLDLTDRLNGWDGWQHFYKRLRDEAVQPDGRVYYVPREATIMQLWYRQDILKAKGISTDQPNSWQELLDRARQAKQAVGTPPILFPAGKQWGGGTFGEGFVHLMLGTNSKLYDTGQKKWIVRSPGLTATLKFYEQLTNEGLLPVQPLLNPEPWVQPKYKDFPAGKLLIETCGTWCWSFDYGANGSAPIKDITKKVATWSFPTENGDGAPFVYGAAGWTWSVTQKSDHPDEAFELVKWLASGQFMAQNAVTIGAAAPRDDLAQLKPYSDQPQLLAAEKQLANARSFPPPEGTDKFQQAVADATEAVISKKANADQAATMLANEAKQLLGPDKVVEQ
jgi:multiple sugar transport system substrate-binding protein